MSKAQINEVIHHPARTQIMSFLVQYRSVDFNTLKTEMKMTDGQVATQTKALEAVGYLRLNKELVGKKTRTTYSITVAGEEAFESYLDYLESLLRDRPEKEPTEPANKKFTSLAQ